MRLLESARRCARAKGATTIEQQHLALALDIEQIDAHGFGPIEQQYLRILRKAGGGPVRLGLIATHMGLPMATVERVIEPDLIRLGWITKDDTGRYLTPQGLSQQRVSHDEPPQPSPPASQPPTSAPAQSQPSSPS